MATAIDVHNHFYPEAYLDKLDALAENYAVERDEEGRDVIVSDGARVVTLTPPMRNIEARLEDMDRAGVDHQLLSLSIPNVNFLDGEESVDLARTCNDAYARIIDEYDDLSALACVPLNEPDAAVDEAERAVNDLGLKGLNIGSAVGGTPLNDDRFEQFYAEVARLDVPIFVHPMTPIGVESMGEYRLAPLVGFENDITLAIARLVFDGVLERHDLNFHLSHLGGTAPYLFARLDNGYDAYPECREHIPKPPSHYLKDVYYDTVSFHHPALRCAIESVGVGQLLLGSDYPHVIGDVDRAVEDIRELALSSEGRRRILGANAAELYDVAVGD